MKVIRPVTKGKCSDDVDWHKLEFTFCTYHRACRLSSTSSALKLLLQMIEGTLFTVLQFFFVTIWSVIRCPNVFYFFSSPTGRFCVCINFTQLTPYAWQTRSVALKSWWVMRLERYDGSIMVLVQFHISLYVVLVSLFTRPRLNVRLSRFNASYLDNSTHHKKPYNKHMHITIK